MRPHKVLWNNLKSKYIPGSIVKVLVLVIAILAVFAGIRSRVLAVEPGTAGDPVVTKSYVEDMYGWKVHALEPGDSIVFDVGTEIVIRSGKATVVAGSGGGLADLTRGADLPGGAKAPSNHLLLAPMSDGRGLRAESSVVFLARGWLP